jgi:hypothetical protein
MRCRHAANEKELVAPDPPRFNVEEFVAQMHA